MEQLEIDTEAELFDLPRDVTPCLRFEEPSAEYQDVALAEEFPELEFPDDF